MTAPLLLHVFSTFRVGGPQVRFCTLANRLGRAWRHRVVAMDGATPARALLANGLDVEILPPPAGLRGARRLLAQLRPDLLVTSNWGSMDWALANLDGRVPHLHQEDGFNPDEAAGQLARRVWTRRLALRRSMVVLPSHTLHTIAREVWKLPPHRLVHIPNGVDGERFRQAPLPAGEPVVGTIAALRPEKNLARLIEAFALVTARRPARLVVVGDGPERPRLEDLARGLPVTFTGPTAWPERLLPAFTVFALSSDTEQMPLSVLEAMAVGRPVAATDVGDVRAMLAPENAPYVTAPTAPALAEAILALLDGPRAAAIGAANARHAREIYGLERMVAAWEREMWRAL